METGYFFNGAFGGIFLRKWWSLEQANVILELNGQIMEMCQLDLQSIYSERYAPGNGTPQASVCLGQAKMPDRLLCL